MSDRPLTLDDILARKKGKPVLRAQDGQEITGAEEAPNPANLGYDTVVPMKVADFDPPADPDKTPAVEPIYTPPAPKKRK